MCRTRTSICTGSIGRAGSCRAAHRLKPVPPWTTMWKAQALACCAGSCWPRCLPTPNLRKRFFLPDYDARVYYSDDAQTYLHLDRVSCAVCRFDCSSALLADSVRPSDSQSESDSLWPDDGRDQLFLRWRALRRAGSGPHCWTRTAVSVSLDACCEGQFRG